MSDKGCCGTGNIEVLVLCNKFSGACDDDTKYVFWDSYHPTQNAYKVLVEQILEKYIDLIAWELSAPYVPSLLESFIIYISRIFNKRIKYLGTEEVLSLFGSNVWRGLS